MVSSMTAFASRRFELRQGVLRWDLKSVNQRYFEASIKLPEIFQELEYSLRDQLRRKINRGKLFCQLQYENNAELGAELELNASLLENLIKNCEVVAGQLKNAAALSPMDLLRWPQVVKSHYSDITEINQAVIQGLSETIEEFLSARNREGLELKGFILKRVQMIEELLATISARLPMIQTSHRNRLMERISDMKIEIDSNRLEQEMLFLAQKMDVAEELDRLNTHLQAVKELLNTGGVIGRHLDFLSQELNREANTLGSKSQDAKLTQDIVEIKVLIEQMREQVQNIE